MSFAPYAALWVALVIVAALLAALTPRPRLGQGVAAALPLVALALGLFIRPDAVWSFAGRSWMIDETARQLTAVVLLLLLAAVVYDRSADAAGASRAASAYALAAGSLPGIWAADDRTRVLSLSLFALLWAASVYFARLQETTVLRERMRPILRIAAGALLLWIGVALPVARSPLGLLSAAVLLGVWPFTTPETARHDALPFLRGGLLVALGAAVTVSALQVAPSGAIVAAATALGLLSLTVALGRAWPHAPERQAGALRVGLSGLALTAAVWVGTPAVIPAARLAIFAPVLLVVVGALGLSSADRDNRVDRWAVALRLAGLLAVLSAVAGLPLTVGFAVLPPLYETWGDSGGWVLLLVCVVLVALWSAGIYLMGRTGVGGAAGDDGAWRRGAALLPLLAGLISLNIAAFGVAPMVWPAVLIPPVAGILLARFAAPGIDRFDELLREAAALPRPAEQIARRFRAVGRATGDALADALAILEGTYGLLWLLGLLLLLLWIA